MASPDRSQTPDDARTLDEGDRRWLRDPHDVKVCIICGVAEGCRKPCCNMGNPRCYGDPQDIGPHIFREVRRGT